MSSGASRATARSAQSTDTLPTPRGRRKNQRPPRPGAPSSGPLSGPFSGPLAKLSDKLRTVGSSKKLAVLPDNLVSNKV